MKILDRYIIKKFLSTFFYTVLIFSMIAVVIDFSTKVEKFMEEPITWQQVVFDYYLQFIPFINAILWPLFSLISVIFFTSRMAKDSEIITILNAGVSFRRILLPYIIAATFIMSINLLLNHKLVPDGSIRRLNIENTYVYKNNDKGQTRNVHLFLSPESKVFIRFYRKLDSTAKDIRLERFEDNQLVEVIKAKTLEWKGEPDKWRIRHFEKRTFDGFNESLVIGGKESLDTILNLHPSDFTRFINQKEMINTEDMRIYVNRQKERGVGNTKEFEVEIQRRTADPFSIIILTIIGVAIASRKVRGGIGLHLATGVAIGSLFIVTSKFSITFSNSAPIHPLLGVWIPNIVFSIVALYLVFKAQK